MSVPTFVTAARRGGVRVKINQTCTGYVAHVQQTMPERHAWNDPRIAPGWITQENRHFDTKAEAHAFAAGVLS